MENRDVELVGILQETSRCRPEIITAAEAFSRVDVRRYEEIARLLIDTGQDTAMGILLCISSLNSVKWRPDLLAETIKIVEPIVDFPFPYKVQDKDAIAPLLAVSQAEDISWERQALAIKIAAELAVRCDSDRQPVRKVLQKLSNRSRSFEIDWMISQSLALLDNEGDDPPMVLLTQLDVLEQLPQERPPVIIGGDYTVRRPIPKIGRNAPCHCGSEKKYKKCCYERDQQLVRDASPHAGITMTQLHANPSLVGDAEMIRNMRAYEIKKLQPTALNPDQLLAAYRTADRFGLRDLALDMLLELKNRPDKEEFAVEHMEDLLQSALNANNLELSQKIKQHIPDTKLHDANAVQFHLDLLENQHHFAALESRCKGGLLYDKDSFHSDDPILDLGYAFENLYPALSIVFSRAAIVGRPDHFFDNEFLLEVIRNARTELDLDPWEDPIQEFFDWQTDRSDFDLYDGAKDLQIQELKEKATEATRLATQKHKELKEREHELSRFAKIGERSEESTPRQAEFKPVKPLSAEDRKTVSDLKLKIDNLKAEIGSQQEDRRHLRKQLKEIQKKLPAPEPQKPSVTTVSDQNDGAEFETAPKKILIPDFTPAFHRSCESTPVAVVANALKAAAGFAAHDKSVFHRTKKIEALPQIFRTRIGLHYRLMIRWEKDTQLQILDLIPRSHLETWIRRHTT